MNKNKIIGWAFGLRLNQLDWTILPWIKTFNHGEHGHGWRIKWVMFEVHRAVLYR